MPESDLIEVDPGQLMRREMVSGSDGFGNRRRATVLDTLGDDLLKTWGYRVYEFMHCEPACNAALSILVGGALGDGPTIDPQVKRDPGDELAETQGTPAPRDERGTESRRRRRERAILAEEIAELCTRAISGLDRPIEETIEDWFTDAAIYGCSVAEATYEIRETGIDAGRFMPVSLAVKPRWAWRFKVDGAMNVRKLDCSTLDGGQRDIRRDKFAILTYRPRYRDPRGTSAYRPAYNAWNRKVNRWGGLENYLDHFADPALKILMKREGNYKDENGNSISPTQYGLNAGKLYKGSKVIVLAGEGNDAQLMEAKGDGAAYHNAFDRDDREIFRGVILGTRPMLEAEHDSKANATTGLDLVELATARLRRPGQRAMRDDFLFTIVRENYGEDVARELTPEFTLGFKNRANVELMKAFAALRTSGILVDELLPYAWPPIGFPSAPPGWKMNRPDPAATKAPGASPGESPTEDEE